MKLSDIWKKGSRKPLPAELIEGGLGVDTTNKNAYSKDSSGNIFEIGKEVEILTAKPTALNKPFGYDKTNNVMYGINSTGAVVPIGEDIAISTTVPTTLAGKFGYDKTTNILYGVNSTGNPVELNTIEFGTY